RPFTFVRFSKGPNRLSMKKRIRGQYPIPRRRARSSAAGARVVGPGPQSGEIVAGQGKGGTGRGTELRESEVQRPTPKTHSLKSPRQPHQKIGLASGPTKLKAIARRARRSAFHVSTWPRGSNLPTIIRSRSLLASTATANPRKNPTRAGATRSKE